MVVPGSHKQWKNRASGQKGSRHKSGFAPLKRDEPDFDDLFGRAVKLDLPANCLVLWNSKTLHGTSPGSRERPHITTTNDLEDEGGASTSGDVAEGCRAAGRGDVVLPVPNRLTCFVAMLPRQLRPRGAIQAKLDVYRGGGSTNHWAHAGEAHPVNSTGPIAGRMAEDGSIPPERIALI